MARTIGLLATLAIARLVPIGDLGAYGVILIGDQALQAVTQHGLTTVIVQMRKDPTGYLDTAWTIQVSRAAFLFLVEVAVAPLWCGYFNVPEATSAMRVLAVGQLILGFHSMSTALLARDLKFDRLFYTYAIESITHVVVTVPAALLLHSIWAPVIGLLAGFSTRVVASYLVLPVRARFRFDLAKAREMLAFTKWLAAYAVADFFLETTDNAVTGRIIGKVPLAHYRMGYQLATEGPLSLQWIVARVALPAFSTIQDDPTRIRINFRALLGLVAVSMFPICAVLAVLADYLVGTLLGPEWAPAAAPLRVLTLGALLRAVIDTAPPVLRALGKTRADFGLKLVQVTVMCALLYPAGSRYGVVGIAGAVVIAAAVAIFPWAFVLRTRVGISARDFAEPVWSPLLAATAATIVVVSLPVSSPSWLQLFARGLLFLAVYLAASYVLYRLAPGAGLGAVLKARERAPAAPPSKST